MSVPFGGPGIVDKYLAVRSCAFLQWSRTGTVIGNRIMYALVCWGVRGHTMYRHLLTLQAQPEGGMQRLSKSVHQAPSFVLGTHDIAMLQLIHLDGPGIGVSNFLNIAVLRL